MPQQGMTAEHIWVEGHNGDRINAYLARPMGPGPFPAVHLFHHMPGWDEASKEMARKFAHNGFIAIMPNLHYRQGHDDPVANSNSIREAGGMPDDRTLGDAAGAISYLQHLSNYNGKVGIIGVCSGGRQVFLAACKLSGINAAVDCWGGGVTPRDSEPPTEAMPHAPIEFVADLSCPMLGIFGADDARPTVEEGTRPPTPPSRPPASPGNTRSTPTPATASSPLTGPATPSKRPTQPGPASSTSTASTCRRASPLPRPS